MRTTGTTDQGMEVRRVAEGGVVAGGDEDEDGAGGGVGWGVEMELNMMVATAAFTILTREPMGIRTLTSGPHNEDEEGDEEPDGAG